MFDLTKKCKNGLYRSGKILNCSFCKKEFYQYKYRLGRKNGYCSKDCRNRDLKENHNKEVACKNCFKLVIRQLSVLKINKNTFCTNSCHNIWRSKNIRGEKAGTYKNGTQVCNGYSMVLSADHPYKNSKNYVYEHRIVMEKSLGRYLEKNEVVHHINLDKKDNRIENLMLFSTNSDHLKFHNKQKIGLL
jgi:hypothetical protein